MGSCAFYAKSFAIQQSTSAYVYAYVDTYLRKACGILNLNFPVTIEVANKCGKLSFFMSEELPYNRIASADVYACEDTYLPNFLA